MKRLLLFLAAIIFASYASAAYAQGNHVLVEEFNSSNCPPCAETDPQIELFEQQSADKICVLKWHQDYPIPGEDPFTNNTMVERANYYGVQGIPSIYMQGNENLFSKYLWSAGPLNDSASTYLAAMQNYYQMSVKHSIIGDSVVVWVTVTTGATQPSATDLNLGVVVAERFIPYHGANGRQFHTDVVRTPIPALATDGAINNPFSQATNTTQTYRYATLLKSSWNASMLDAVAFIQSAGASGTTSKPVYQSAWDEPAISVIGDGAFSGPMPVIAGNSNSTANYTLTNNSSSSQKIFISTGLKTPGTYSIALSGVTLGTDSSVTIPANGSITLTASVASNGPAVTVTDYSILFHTADTIGIGGGAETAFGANIQHPVVNQWTEPNSADLALINQLQASVAKTGYGATGIISSESFEQLFGLGASNDWSQFKTVIYDDGQNAGINYFTDTSLITNFLNGGGNFILESPTFPYLYSSLYPSYGYQGTDQWMQNVFHFENLSATNGGYTSVTGVAGDPIGSAVTGRITVTSTGVTQTIYSVDDSSHGVFIDPAGDTVATRATSNGGKVFYSSFALGGITASKRDAVVQSIMNWFYGTAGVNDQAPTNACSLNPAYPNPLLSDAGTIGYTLPDSRYVTLIVRDVMGRKIATLVSREQGAGHYTAPFDASHLANGTYIYTLTAGDYKADGKITVNR